MESAKAHKAAAQAKHRILRVTVLTISDTRTLETDVSGTYLVAELALQGHELVHRGIVRDEPDEIRAQLRGALERDDLEIIITSGGTGIATRDGTIEVVESLVHKAIPGFGELFRMLSYKEIGPAAMLSRATAGLVARTSTKGPVLIIALPGSINAVTTAWQNLLKDELVHMVWEARR